ncbi:MAG: TonB-dependent receptor plug domain-containing protein [Opitutaceae bacterium]
MRTVPEARRLLPLACVLLSASAIALAQPAAPTAPADPNEDVVVLDPFMVSSQTEDRYRSAEAISALRVRAPLLETPSSLTVITRELIEDLAPNRVFDVTRFVAGVQEGRGIQFQDRMIIRGFETQNGARTVDNFLQSADADNVEEAIIERIEVTKGPNAILSPAGAPGGSLNIVTKSPLYQPRRTLTAQLGLYDAQKVTIDLSGPLAPGSDFAYRLVGSWQDSRRYWSSDAKIRNKALAPMFSWKISDKTLLTVKLVGADHWIFREPLLILDPRVNASTDNPYLAPGIAKKGLNGIQDWSHVDTQSADLFAVLTTQLNEHISLRFAANGRYYYETSDQEFLSTPGLNNRYDPYTGVLTQDYTWALTNPSLPHNATTNPYVSTYSPFFNPTAIPARGDKQWSTRRTGNFQADAVGSFKFGGMSSQTVTGLAWSHQDGDTRNKNTPGGSILIDLTNPDRKVYPTYPDSLSYRNGSSYQNLQLYLNQRFGLFDDRLYLTGGILHYETLTKAWNALTNSGLSVLDDSKMMWTASALFKIRHNVSVYYSHSTNSSPVIANNQPLWRDGVQDEVGIKTEFFNQRLSLNGSWFEINQTNVTVPNPARQTDPTAPEQLVSDLGNHGLEFEVMGSLTPNLSVIATYSHLKMRDALGRRVRGVADENASLLLNYRFADGTLKGLTLAGGVVFNGRRAGDVPINYTPLNVVGQTSFYLKAQYVTTFSATYRWSERLMTRLNVDNLFDDKGYISVAGGRVSGTGITTAPGINVRLSTTFSF